MRTEQAGWAVKAKPRKGNMEGGGLWTDDACETGLSRCFKSRKLARAFADKVKSNPFFDETKWTAQVIRVMISVREI